ncbi:MAG TPA: PA0069 family radical SAM protein [Polyangiaceae bacterium]|nr:PA0069 family radical SAM protein [Polyangiaceae bacterium]
MLRRLPLANPIQRWQRAHIEYDPGEVPEVGLEIYEDETKNILSENDSPDLPFRFSLNPYRGCAHGCAYCYARPSHEYWGFGSGSDFERKLLVKRRAPELLAAAFERKSWRGDLLVLSGNTDCYQPIESRYELTRRCLEVCRDYRNPVHLITKSTLIERDIDVLCELHAVASVGISVSVTFWDAGVARAIEPYVPTPRRRIETIRRLTQAGLPVMVHVAPVIVGLSDRDMIPILEAAREAGALSALMMPVRLPGSVAEVFEARLREALPLRADRVMARLREMHDGKLNDPRFGYRQRGQGRYAEALQQSFEATCRRLGFGELPEPRTGTFLRKSAATSAAGATPAGAQLKLF